MIKLRQLLEASRLLRAGKALGDGAVLKGDALNVRASRDVEARLEPVRGYLPAIDVDALARLPKGTPKQCGTRKSPRTAVCSPPAVPTKA